MDQELEKFKTDIDLRAYATAQNYQLDRKESWSGSSVMRHPNNDKIVIKRNVADGHYLYFSVRAMRTTAPSLISRNSALASPWARCGRTCARSWGTHPQC